MPIDLEKFISKVVGKVMPSLLVGITATDGCTTIGCYCDNGCAFHHSAPSAVDILIFLNDELGIGFPISRGAIIANHEKLPRETPGWWWSLSEGVGVSLLDGLGGAL